MLAPSRITGHFIGPVLLTIVRIIGLIIVPIIAPITVPTTGLTTVTGEMKTNHFQTISQGEELNPLPETHQRDHEKTLVLGIISIFPFKLCCGGSLRFAARRKAKPPHHPL